MDAENIEGNALFSLPLFTVKFEGRTAYVRARDRAEAWAKSVGGLATTPPSINDPRVSVTPGGPDLSPKSLGT